MTIDLLPAIESELQRQVARLDHPATAGFHSMLAYHMGWTGEGAGPEAAGKRLRPLILCLVYLACQPAGSVESALPAAAAIELVHNFSLVHDDIEDNSPTRRGRPTVWTKWGLPMAVNAGDALFVIAHQAIMDLSKSYPPAIVVRAAHTLQSVCLELTRGQYLDMSFEDRTGVTEDEYWRMISGKTAALLSAACLIGAILGTSDPLIQEQYANFGHDLGLAFQVQDDILGIWGEESTTGKSAASDLVEGKNSLPILYALNKGGAFARRWRQGRIQPSEVPEIAALLKNEGAYDYAQERAHYWTSRATNSLEQAKPKGEAAGQLSGLVTRLLGRQH
jgi:geranylgeranyl diphosphate synthase type I